MTDIRTAVAMHPELVLELEKLADVVLLAAVDIGTPLVVDAVPLGEFLKPVIAAALNEIRLVLAAKIDHALNEYIQAEPDVKQGDGHAGLISIEEIATVTTLP